MAASSICKCLQHVVLLRLQASLVGNSRRDCWLPSDTVSRLSVMGKISKFVFIGSKCCKLIFASRSDEKCKSVETRRAQSASKSNGAEIGDMKLKMTTYITEAMATLSFDVEIASK